VFSENKFTRSSKVDERREGPVSHKGNWGKSDATAGGRAQFSNTRRPRRGAARKTLIKILKGIVVGG